ncbi:MAG: right-handed parallel beta-helix repeat-containing protein [Bacteroidota bacterium]|nr:right-handed parallel beta-helix repeat-containing protein [Bacteroidota bacterium]
MDRKFSSIILLVLISILFSPEYILAQKFIHPGIDMTSSDLEYMKKQVLAGEQPWKDAFERLKTSTNLQFEIKPFTHVLRGPYGKPNIGGDDLRTGSELAYNCALMWYITNDKTYAQKAIEIINAWSPVLWDFDYNDAKLLAGWTGHMLCNAAEILKYTDSGWQQKDIDRFNEMLMAVYYPLMRFYYPQANGNWDGAIIHSILAIAIFTDNREMFSNAIDHFLHAPVNGSLFKYIYPSGQCQESMRDQGHVQLGLGEFAGAAKVAFTQGVNLFSIANNRLALGYEYTSQFLMGKTPHCYGKISDRAKNLRDDFEYVYRHYTATGIEVPFTKQAADSIRPKASRSVLTAFRAPSGKELKKQGSPLPSPIAFPAGAMENALSKASGNVIRVKPGRSIQEALNQTAGKNGWVVATAGLHKLPATLKIPSGVTLSGEGLATVLFLDPASGVRDAITNADDDMHDVILCDLVIEGATDPDPGSDPNSRRSYRSTANRGGIIFLGQHEEQMKNITLRNITVKNCTYNGVFISGAKNLNILCCDFNENGASVVPGPRLQHNLLLTHCSNISIKDSRMDTSPHGCGIAFTNCTDTSVANCELARNAWFGMLVTESKNISISGSLIEANDRSGIMVQYLYRGSENVSISNNLIHYNNGFGVEAYSGKNIKSAKNSFAGNGKDLKSNEKIVEEKYLIMQ